MVHRIDAHERIESAVGERQRRGRIRNAKIYPVGLMRMEGRTRRLGYAALVVVDPGDVPARAVSQLFWPMSWPNVSRRIFASTSSVKCP
jgi:hypothetical protein